MKIKISLLSLTVIFLFFLLLSVVTCFSPWKGDEIGVAGKLTIALSESGRTAIGAGEPVFFRHQITLNGPGGKRSSPLLAPGTGSYTFTGLAKGYYVISVEARHSSLPSGYSSSVFPPRLDGYMRAYGEEGVQISLLERKPLRISMYPATEVANWDQFSAAFFNLGTKEFIVLTGDITIDYNVLEIGDALGSGPKKDLTIVTKGARTIKNLYSSGIFNVISNNTLNLGSPFTQSDLTISGSGATGPIIEVAGTLSLHQGVTLSGNIRTGGSDNGGAVYVNGGNFYMTGGTIHDNEAGNNGGGVYINGGNFYMTGGTISGNTAGYNGGGVYIGINGKFYKTGGIIYGSDGGSNANITLPGHGAAVYVEKTGTFPTGHPMQGTPIREITVEDTLTGSLNSEDPVYWN